MNFSELLNSEESLDDLHELNEPNLTSNFSLSQYHSSGSTLEETNASEDNIDQEAPSAPCYKKSQKQSQRSTNFSLLDEDKLLVSSWLNTSLDPIKGSDQKKSQFWKRIAQNFEKERTWPEERTEKSLINWWAKISYDVSRFSGHYDAVEHLRRSGHTEADKIQEAKTVYKEKEGHQFGLDHRWTILRYQEKWMAESKKIESSRSCKPLAKNQISINLEDDNENAPKVAPLKRPIGRKAAKEANKKAKSNMQGDDAEKESLKIRTELEEFRARRLESDRVKAEQLKVLIDIEQKQVALREKEIELQAQSEETKIMCMDTSSMNPLQAEYIISLQREILAKRVGKNGNE